MSTSRLKADVLVLGGGIAGLWTAARLRQRGLRCLLVEPHALGTGQTIASQGIIHGGIKYALTGAATRASAAIAAMPEVWRRSLAGTPCELGLDLRAARVLAQHQHLWTIGGAASRLAALAASCVLRTPVRRTPREELPPALAPSAAPVYSVDEQVIDPRSLLAALAALLDGALLHAAGPGAIRFAQVSDRGVLLEVRADAGDEIEIDAPACVFAAGSANEHLLRQALAGALPSAHVQQIRPLHQVYVRAPRLPTLFGHCVTLSPTPRLTITTSEPSTSSEPPTSVGGSSPPPPADAVWSIGGRLAEEGVLLSREDQIDRARREIRECLPWLDLAGACFAAVPINRAEGLTPTGDRPDEPVVRVFPPFIVAWPTKLAFAPLLAERIERLLPPSAPPASSRGFLERVAPPPIALRPWEEEELKWT